MSENKDPSFKLFGERIQLGSNFDEDTIMSSRIEPSITKFDADFDCQSTSSDHKFPCSKQSENRVNKEPASKEPMDAEQEGEQSSMSALEEPKTPTSQSNEEENINTGMSLSQDLSKNDNDHNDQASSNSESSEQNPLKKPDKILPCARCSSMDTKFCYFNNYNVNQPRHFCKNCQRYWTAGGSMRNVPVGAGRRKSKNSTASHPRQLVIPGSSYGLIHHVMKPDGTVFAFGVDDSFSNESKVSMMKLGEGSQSFPPNGLFRLENEKKSSNSDSISIEKKGEYNGGGTDSCQVVPCFSYGWNPIPQQTAFPVSFYSGSTPQWGENLAAPWNLNWVPTPLVSSDQSSTNSSPNTSPLGKHSRECLPLMPSESDNKDSTKGDLESSRVVIPKTLRIDDPSEAAKSSIWSTLGIKNNHIGSSSGRVAFFGGLQHAKGVPYERRNINQNVETSSMVLQANPAAFSRSLSFHEIAQ